MNFNNIKVAEVPGSGQASTLLKAGIIVFNRLVYSEGTHLIVPWFERPIIYDVRARPHLVESTSGSRELQMVKIGLRVLTRPVPGQLPTIYLTLGENYNERILPSIIHETLKAVVARYNTSQLILREREFTAAIEAKQVAAQDAERTKFIVEKAEQDKKSAIIRAQGEAKSAQLIGQAIANNPAFITLRKVEAAREIANTISNSASKVFLDSDDRCCTFPS
ncbi:hypothetical protein I3760_11G187500 [Carya illinoinensis]|nr:hypothetical protein I3760_11G187500 [Carya illinoinensis]